VEKFKLGSLISPANFTTIKNCNSNSFSWIFGEKHNLLEMLRNFYGTTSCAGSFMNPSDRGAWIELMGAEGEKGYVLVSEMANSKISKFPLAQKIAQMRSEIITLDDGFRKKGKNRGSFVSNLLKRG
jgi:hypothetical protein